MLLIDPTLEPEAAVAEVTRLATEFGYIGVRMNAGLWAKKGTPMDDPTGQAVMECCGELGLSAGFLCGDFEENALAIEALATAHSDTKIVIDHFAGLEGPSAGAPWLALLRLAECKNVTVKVSGWFRHGAESCGAATLSLLEAYGASRLMFGTDFPWVMGEGEKGYAHQWNVFDEWAASNLTDEQTAAIAGGTAATFFGFGGGAKAKI